MPNPDVSQIFPRVLRVAESRHAPHLPLLTLDHLNGWIAADPGMARDVNVYVPGFPEFGWCVRCDHDDQEQIAIATDALVYHLKSVIMSIRDACNNAGIVWRDRPEMDVWRGPEYLLVKIYARFAVLTADLSARLDELEDQHAQS